MPIRQPSLPERDAIVHPIYARMLRLLLQRTGADGDRVIAAAGLDPQALAHDDRRLSRDHVSRLISAALAETRQPWLGLELGAQAPISAHGAIGYAAVTARDLRECLAVIARYGTLRNDAFAWSMRVTAQGAELHAAERIDWGPARGFVIDALVAAVLRVIEAALGAWPAGLRVDLPVPMPRWSAEYGRFTGVTIRFDQPMLSFQVDAASLALPCLGADRAAHASACRECETAIAALAGRSLAQRVAALLADVPAHGAYPQLAEVALACGTSPRTLMRHLRAEDTSFQQLLDAARRTHALWLLQHTSQSVEAIAAQLGYADTSNFSRTVRRWFGATPRALRQGAGTQTGAAPDPVPEVQA